MKLIMVILGPLRIAINMGNVASKACHGKRRRKNANVSQNGSNSKTAQQDSNPNNSSVPNPP